jgi:site-specific recombinase XerC
MSDLHGEFGLTRSGAAFSRAVAAPSRRSSEANTVCQRSNSKPLRPDSVPQKSIRPAPVRAGIVDKQIGWHSFRHSLATNLRTLGVGIKVAQELLRHSSCRTTLDIRTRAVSQRKREASSKVVEMMQPLEVRKITTLQHSSAPSEQRKATEWMSKATKNN